MDGRLSECLWICIETRFNDVVNDRLNHGTNNDWTDDGPKGWANNDWTNGWPNNDWTNDGANGGTNNYRGLIVTSEFIF